MLSKSLKEPKKNKVLNNISYFFLMNVYYPVTDNVNRFIKKVIKAYQFAKFGWNNYDYVYTQLFSIMSFKMKRIENCLKNGIAVQQSEDMDALSEAIQICERISNESYEDKYYAEHDKKWGEIEFETGPTFSTKRKNVISKKDKQAEIKDSRNIWKKAEQDYKNDIDRLAHIFKAHAKAWWE